MKFLKSIITLLVLSSVAAANPFYANILFDKGVDTLTGKTEAKLDKVTSSINADSLVKNGEKIIITGFADQAGGTAGDTTLALNRAKIVAKRIHERHNIPKSLIVVRAEAGQKYHILTVTAEGRRLNRRAEIVIRRMKKKKAKAVPTVLNIVASEKARFSKSDSLMQITSGDTVTVEKGGFCRLSYGSRSTIDLDEFSQLTISGKNVVLIKGALQLHRSVDDEQAPQFSVDKNGIVLTENGSIYTGGNSSVFVTVFSGSAVVKSKYGTKKAHEMQGVVVLPEKKVTVVTDLPTQPVIELEDTLSIISGLTAPVRWSKSGESYIYRISSDENFSGAAEQEQTQTETEISSKPGTYYVQVQAKNEPGFYSLWSAVKKVTVQKRPAITSLTPFEDTLFVTSHKRPFAISGVADTNTKLFFDTTELSLDKDGAFSHEWMLGDDVNKLHFISVNPDMSRDTVEAFILYTGADEVIYVNDSIMGKEAFTTSRHYRFRGSMPTATALKINGEEIPLDENRYFEKRFKLPGYEKMPVDLDITFENGHRKTINCSVERIEHNTPLQQALYSFLGIAAVSAIFVFIALQAD